MIEKFEQIKKLYSFTDTSNIETFLNKNDFLIDILLEAPEHIRKVFGDDINLFLELEDNELFIIIKSKYMSEKAVKLEEKLFDEWFIGIMDKIDGKLNFMEEPYK